MVISGANSELGAERRVALIIGNSAYEYWWGDSITTNQANYDGYYPYDKGEARGVFRRRTLPVSAFEPNPWGLYQVHGNVWEWTEDCRHENYENAPNDGSAWTTGECSVRILRGGAWNSHGKSLRAANRGKWSYPANIGFSRLRVRAAAASSAPAAEQNTRHPFKSAFAVAESGFTAMALCVS